MRKILKVFGIILAVLLSLVGVYFAVLYFGLDGKFTEKVLKPLKAKLANCSCPCLKKQA